MMIPRATTWVTAPPFKVYILALAHDHCKHPWCQAVVLG